MPRMGRLKVVRALAAAGLAAGCAADEHAQPRHLEEMAREQARVIVRETAADAVRRQFGELPAPLREFETGCDSARWNHVADAYVTHAVWELPLAAEDHERTLRELHNRSGRFKTQITELGPGRFALDGYDPDDHVGYAVTSGEPPTTVRVWAGSSCLLDPR